MRQFVPMQLNNLAVNNPELAKELQKINNFCSQISHAVTTNAIATGQQPSAVVSGTNINMAVKEDGTSVSAVIDTLDFGTGLDVTESPTGEANITVDVTEVIGSADHGNMAGLTDDDHTQYILVDGTRAFTGDQSMGGFGFTNVDDIAGASGADLELISTETDAAGADGFIINWDANVATPTDKATIANFGWTDNGDVYNESAKVYAHYRRSGLGANGAAILIPHNAGEFPHMGFHTAGTEAEFTGMEFSGTVLSFLLDNTTVMASISGGVQIRTTLETQTGQDLNIRPRGTNSASTNLVQIRPRNARTVVASQKLLDVSSNDTSAGITDQFAVWDHASGGAGVPQDMKFSFDDVANTRGDTYLLYDSAGSTLDVFVDATQVMDASTTVVRTVVAHQIDGNVGFYGTTPVAQPAHIVDADGTLADITTKFNTLLAQVATLGLQAAS